MESDVINGTTGGFKSDELAAIEETLVLEKFDNSDAIELGKIVLSLATERNLPAAIEVRIGDWPVFRAMLPGTNSENDWWMARKARVVKLTGHSSMHQRVASEEGKYDWFARNGVKEDEYAIHGGGNPIHVRGKGLVGTLLISGLPQITDHLLGVEAITEFLARAGE
jgi:uncharacterized protein (UPF0303 family)